MQFPMATVKKNALYMFEMRFFVSVKYDEIWCGGVVFKRGNVANISSQQKKTPLLHK
jgi:hypothetical protein